MNTSKAQRKKKLAVVPHGDMKRIFQPNKITNAHYDFTLIQERVFVFIVFYLNTYLNKIMNGECVVTQLDIFTQTRNTDYIDIPIPLSMIGKPRQYNEIRERVAEMVFTKMSIKDKDVYTGYNVMRVQGLLTHVDIPLEGQERRYSGTLNVRMSKSVAMMMLNVERENGSPINYTSFLFEVALRASNKYTSRIYKIMSSWKTKKLWKVTYEELRTLLQVGNKYKDYEAFKRRILVPVMEELKELGDFWFDCSDPKFESREGKKITYLNFVHKFPTNDEDPALTECKLWNRIVHNLRRAWDMDDAGIAMIAKMKGIHNLSDIESKIHEAYVWRYRPDVMGNPDKRVADPKKYITKILQREFPLS